MSSRPCYERRSERWIRCCDPLNRHSYKIVKIGCRLVPSKLKLKHPDLDLDCKQYLCTSCRLALCKRQTSETEPSGLQKPLEEPGLLGQSSDLSQPGCSALQPPAQGHTSQSRGTDDCTESSDAEEQESYSDESDILNSGLEAIDKSAQALGDSPIRRKRLRSKRYRRFKMKKIRDAMHTKIMRLDPDAVPVQCAGDNSDEKGRHFDEMMGQLRHKFKVTDNPSEKIKILTVVPRSWTIRRIVEEFGASRHQARCARNLQITSGCLSEPNPRGGKVIKQETEELVLSFYRSEQVSREMPGIKDVISVRSKGTGNRERVQKRLILCNLKEAFR